MWPDRVSNPGPLTYESGALPTALRGPVPPYYGVVGWCDGAGQTSSAWASYNLDYSRARA